ncbi:MAG: tetratricopeptide repeat protein [Candidatus Hodarchaeales archaeon]|jgi:tetratricopeptide (TPR) repeat protein
MLREIKSNLTEFPRKKVIFVGIVAATFLGGFIDPIFGIIGLVAISGLLGYQIYKNNFLAMKLVHDLPEKEKEDRYNYYEMKEWTQVVDEKNNRISKIVYFFITWVLLSIFVSFLDKTMNILGIYDSNFQQSIKLIVQLSWIALVELGVYIGVLFLGLFRNKELGKEAFTIGEEIGRSILSKAFLSKHSKIAKLTILIFGSFNVLLLIWLNIRAFFTQSFGFIFSIIGIVVAAVVVAGITGRFFYLFTINKYFKIRNWDFINGKPIRPINGSRWQQSKGVITQLHAGLALFFLPIGLLISVITVSFGFLDFMLILLSNDWQMGGIMNTLLTSYFLPESYDILLLLLNLGPLLVILISPFEFVDMWINRGLYDMMASSWDEHTLNFNIEEYKGRLFYFTHLSPNFHWKVVIYGILFLILPCLGIIGSLSTIEVPSELIIHFKGFTEALGIFNIVFSSMFLLTLIILSLDRTEEGSMLIFAQEGLKYYKAWERSRKKEARQQLRVNKKLIHPNLVNEAFYSIYQITQHNYKKAYLEFQPDSWGLKWYSKGLNDAYTITERIQAMKYALSLETIDKINVSLIPSLKKSALINLGYFYDLDGQTHEARIIYQQVRDLDPGYAIDLKIFGDLYRKKNLMKTSAIAYQQALSLDPKNAVTWNNLGYVFQQTDCLPEAEKAYQQALSLDPKYAVACHNLGNLYIKTNRFPEAEKAFIQAITLDPNFTIAWKNLGYVYRETDRIEEAEKADQQVQIIERTHKK